MLADTVCEEDEDKPFYEAYLDFEAAVVAGDAKAVAREWPIYKNGWKNAKNQKIIGLKVPSRSSSHWRVSLSTLEEEWMFKNFKRDYRIATKVKGGLTWNEFQALRKPRDDEKE